MCNSHAQYLQCICKKKNSDVINSNNICGTHSGVDENSYVLGNDAASQGISQRFESITSLETSVFFYPFEVSRVRKI
jgi:hypothetical protein